MEKSITRQSEKSGFPPGTLIHVGEKRAEAALITYFDYNEQKLEEGPIEHLAEFSHHEDESTVTWINIDGLQDIPLMEEVGRILGLHPLTLEDIVNTTQRPKLEEFDKYLFVVLKMLTYNNSAHTVDTEQVSLVLGPNYVVSFQERKGDVFDNVRNRIRAGKGRIRKMGPDYLAYSLIDAIVDNYFFVIERMQGDIESLEPQLLDSPTEEDLRQIHSLKRLIISLRKTVWPLRELISGLERSESSLIAESTTAYLRDVYDHTIQVIDAIEDSRDMVTAMLDIYMSSVSNRMNAVMKILTIIATIFIPITFVAGIYGMNFRHMPELEWTLGYPLAIGVMAAIVGVMLAYFKKNKWF